MSENQTINGDQFILPPPPTWEASFFGGDVLVSIVNPPNFFHRWMWSLLLGAKWRKLNV